MNILVPEETKYFILVSSRVVKLMDKELHKAC
jgi:hypothetical protein